MRNHHPSKEQVNAQAEWVSAFGEPTRLRIIRALSTGEKTVTELAKIAGTEVVNVSHHLGILKAAGVVTVERDGRFMWYTLASEAVATATQLQMTHESGTKMTIPLN